MEFEFDKEIDILLRHAARGGDAATESVVGHLDADEINAFAEQSLSEKSRMRAIEHFADCPRCRKILSNLTLFNSASESEIVHAEEKKIPAAIAIPWYKKPFMFPQIAYAMGALALIFGGIIAAIVLKDSTKNYSSDVARMDKQSESPSVFSAGSNANTASNAAANYSNSAGAMSNAASTANSNSMTVLPTPELKNNQPTGAVNTSVPETPNKNIELAKPAPKPVEQSSDDEKIAVKDKEKRDDVVTAAPPASSKKENTYTQDGAVTTDADVARQQNETSQNQTGNLTRTMPDTRSVQSLPMVTRRTQKSREEEALAGSSANAENANKSAETKSIGGKNFRRSDGVWYDVNYRNQKTINLTRNSNEYKKLDAGLRSIADKLGGVVVIVSGSKAYRIQ